MFTTSKIALAAIMIFGAASAALATDHEDDTSSLAQINRDAAEARGLAHASNGGTANAYFVSPSEQDTRKKGHSR